jgi:hypothetical protein
MKTCRWPFLAAVLTVTGAAVPGAAHAQAGAPPVPKTIDFGNFFPGVARFVSTIDNFEGTVAVAHIQGTGTDNKGNTLQFEVDVRPMQGVYADPSGFLHLGTFAFT